MHIIWLPSILILSTGMGVNSDITSLASLQTLAKLPFRTLENCPITYTAAIARLDPEQRIYRGTYYIRHRSYQIQALNKRNRGIDWGLRGDLVVHVKDEANELLLHDVVQLRWTGAARGKERTGVARARGADRGGARTGRARRWGTGALRGGRRSSWRRCCAG
jgi:hypothetical protein